MDVRTPRSSVTADDLRFSTLAAVSWLRRLTSSDWGKIDSCMNLSRRDTVAHIIEAFGYCVVNFSNRTSYPVQRLLRADKDASVDQILASLPMWAEVLIKSYRGGVHGDARGAHRWGIGDAEGFLAMGCVEVLVHTYDVSLGIADFRGDAIISERVVRRLFPWAPIDSDPWRALLWSTGRAEIADFESPGAGWVWHNEPLEEWDGTMKVRSSLPH